MNKTPIKMNYYKKLGKNRKKEELPSYLVGLTDAPEEINFSSKPSPSVHYLGPIFLGLCTNYQHHAPPHSLKLGSFHQPQYIMLPGADDISKLLYPQTKADKVTQTISITKPEVKRQETFQDIYPHKCTGSKKMFIPDVHPHVIDLGKTRSIIEGETSIEIPLSRTHNAPHRHKGKSMTKRENDFITLSDIREERRKFMSYKERIAHAHFPKEFTTVRVIGPTIPASITITKLPTKRKTESQINFELKSETEKLRTAETEKFRRKSTKSKSVTSTWSKKFSKKSLIQNLEDVEKPEEETGTEDKVSRGSRFETEEEEEFGEGAEEKEEIEGEKDVTEEEEEEREKTKTEEKEETKTEEKEETKTEEKEETKTGEKLEAKTEVKEEPKAEVTEEPKTEIKEEQKTEIKEEAKTEEKEETKTEETVEAKIEVKEEPKAEVKEGSKTGVKAEPKTEVKEGSKTGVKAEPKTEVKERSKTGVKAEAKTEVKEEKTKAVHIKQEISKQSSRVSNITKGSNVTRGSTATRGSNATETKEEEEVQAEVLQGAEERS